MKNLSINILKLFSVWAITVFLVASCGRFAYASGVHPHGESVLTDCKFSNGVHSAPCGFFVRKISMHSHVMAELERDTFMCAGIRLSLSVNPFQLCHHYLTVVGKAPLNSNGAHSYA
ncbi:hypothetical protein E0H83_07375 [Acinetobacter terrestris]|uniref:hypothetical protein n=1 Tax=Acinetobacter terrestris TaxID=2529843 RepID=UPI00103EFDA9|nr:hypothetical protein [Acinetobacter terrestris]TCB45355.1 hypothetical protein E0H83_07375 [Acinetobacter terrestris]